MAVLQLALSNLKIAKLKKILEISHFLTFEMKL